MPRLARGGACEAYFAGDKDARRPYAFHYCHMICFIGRLLAFVLLIARRIDRRLRAAI